MTTTKKKAKAPTLEQRVKWLDDFADELDTRITELEAWQRGERARGDHFAGRCACSSAVMRPAEKPAADVPRVGDTITDPQQAVALPVGSVVVGAGGGDTYEKTGTNTWKNSVTGMVWRDHNMVRDTVIRVGYDPPAPATSAEESRLRDAVVLAAISVVEHGHSLDDHLIDDVKALLAHRAKKGT